jgi:hypothetical protein
MRRFFKRISVILFLVLVIEAVVAIGLARPDLLAHMPRAYNALMRGIYIEGARNVIQFEPECARYDSGLTYTLKPGEFTFSNAEFKTKYRVNSQGIRSDEADLVRPDLIVIGDSRAMGWGVSQEEMYSGIIREQSGLKTLNAAVSSYGTVREMKLLDRLDVSALKVLVVHYADNDFEENTYFSRHNNFLRIMDKEQYQKVQRRYLAAKRYFFGEYTLLLLYRLAAEGYEGVTRLLGLGKKDLAVKYFLNALVNGRKTSLDGIRLIVMGNGEFLEVLKKEIASGNYPGYIENAALVTDDVPETGYYILDNHMNKNGHRLLAERLLHIIA